MHSLQHTKARISSAPRNLIFKSPITCSSTWNTRGLIPKVVIGDCIRYLRSNTRPETYAAVVTKFERRLRERQYPSELVQKVTSRIKFSSRPSILNKPSFPKYQPRKATFKCLPIPKLQHLKTIVLQDYQGISNIVGTPTFVSLAHPSLQKKLVRAEVKPTADQLLDNLLRLQDLPVYTSHPESSPN